LDAIKDESPEGLKKFASFENIVITPHIAYLADSTVKTIWDETYRCLEQ
jgi:phosphoglycerate dehydrogenase-like enzyme